MEDIKVFIIIRKAFMALILLTLLTGIAYPLLVTGLSQAIFPYQANGSIIVKNGKPVGSALIGQQFDDPKYFWGRPSATTPYPYNGSLSSGSNLGPDNPELIKAVQARIQALHAADPGNTAKIPVDLVTASGSGLDPHISPAAAEYQVRRVALARGISEAKIRALIAANTEGREFGILGEPRVNVLKLNLALDDL
ncbi:potassium-transporting ATPase subunit KdpC [Dissulfurimicrobium sp.]|uniref:potassium-transporting ATPase subunit KdpC n=1 Tax=Dissulfurimicrobium sp. TaxID=2022436 RepID=UPI003D0AD0B3